jgi:hypothetical protein
MLYKQDCGKNVRTVTWLHVTKSAEEFFQMHRLRNDRARAYDRILAFGMICQTCDLQGTYWGYVAKVRVPIHVCRTEVR